MITKTIDGVTKVLFGMAAKYGNKAPLYLFHTETPEYYVHPAYHNNMYLRMSVDNYLKDKGLTVDALGVTVCNTETEFLTYLEQAQKVACGHPA